MITQNWFITGASSGLGAALARAALRAGHRVAVTARNSGAFGKLAETYPDAVLPLSMDLTQVSEIKAAIAAAEEWHGGINVLVNNAAIGYKAAIEEGEEHNIRKLFETNFFGVTSTIRAALPGMRARARGTIVNISSVGGVVSVPGVGYYCASKHALEGLTDALAEEVAPLGIRVMSVEPGGFRTGIAGRNLQSPRIDAHGPTAHKIMDLLRVENESTYAPGDPVRMAEILVDLVNSGDMPERLSMGADSWMAIMAKLDVLRAGYETWKKVAYSTYFS